MKNFKNLLIQLLLTNIATEAANVKRHNTIKEFLTPLEGKKIDGHIKRKLPEGMKLIQQYSMYYIELEGKQHLIGYEQKSYNPEAGYISIENFEKHDACHGYAAQERLDKMNSLMQNSDQLAAMARYAKNLQDTAQAFKEAAISWSEKPFDSYHNEIHYEVLRSIGIDSLSKILDNLKEVKL